MKLLSSPTFTMLFLLPLAVVAQVGVKGQTRSISGEILPFSTVYVKGTTNGTTSNSEGEFLLKLPYGTHVIVAQHVGYERAEVRLSITENQQSIQHDFELREQALQLKEVVVTAGDEDPAYRVIREAMKRRAFHEEEVQAFKCQAYLKGLQRLDKRPDKILGVKMTIDTGIVYLSESVSEFAFERPNHVSERMISSKVSGDEQGFSFNQASDFNINVYQKNLYLDGLSERAFVSPISSGAFLFYDYKWLGMFEENGSIINKIKLLPKRGTDPVFDGIIYITEDSWRLHTIDLMLVKSRGIEFADSIRINQVYAPSDFDIWMPLSQNFEFKFKAFGFKGSGYFVGVYSDYEVEPNYEAYKKEGLYEEKFGKKESQDLFEKEDFTPETLLVEQGSNERDTTYWNNIRPVPLTAIEIIDYHVKDSMRLIKESVPYKDSVDAEQNKLTLGNVFLSGYTHGNSIKETYWSLPPLISILQYNTVEGFVTEIQPTIWKQENERTKYAISPAVRYGFSNEKFNAKLDGTYRFLDEKFTELHMGGGRYVAQFDESVAIPPFINSYVTLVKGRNFQKIFQKSFGYFKFQQEVKNGVLLNAKLAYASRDTLTNTSDFTWASDDQVQFTSNQPYNTELNETGTGFATHQALILETTFRLRFKQTYATRPDRRVIYPSKYPEVFITYKKGIKTLGSDVNFDFVRVRVKDDMKVGLVGTSNYDVAAGVFLNDESLTFVDFAHFSANQTALSQVGRESKFELLPFYQFSTTKPYFEAHYEHHFNEFIFNKIPLVKKLNLQAVASANYLTTETIGRYVEIGAGIEHIFKFMRLDYYWAFRNNDFFGRGLRVGIGF